MKKSLLFSLFFAASVGQLHAYVAQNEDWVNVTLEVSASQDAGIVTADTPLTDGKAVKGTTIILTATPNYGGIFEKWSDGNTDNPRQVTLTQDTTFRAEFERIYTPTEVYEISTRLSTDETTEASYLIRGRVSSIEQISTDYGNATFYISDGTTSFYCYRLYYLFSHKYTSNTQLQEGDEVTIYAQLCNFHNYLTEAKLGYIRKTSRVPMFNIGDYAFTKLNSSEVAIFYAGKKHKLTHVDIPSKVEYQGSSFSVTKIGESGFYGCNGLTEFVIPDNITILGDEAIAGCENLHKVTIGRNVKTFEGEGNHVFMNCSKIDTVIWNAVHCNDMDWSPFYYARENMKEIRISSDIEWLPANLCWGMGYLRALDIPASVVGIGKDAFHGCINLEKVYIPNKVESIGKSAFHGCTSLKTLSLGTNISNYSDSVFYGCRSLSSIYNYHDKPAKLGKGAFDEVDYFNCTLYVLASAVDMYKSSGSDWKDFYFIEAISADGASAQTVQITSYATTANIVWPEVEGAISYELIIRDKHNKEICSLIFNEKGLLNSITFNAPARNKIAQQSQASAFSFLVTGLNRASKYMYVIKAKDSTGKAIQTYEGVFYTEGYDHNLDEAIEEFSQEAKVESQKLMIDGHLYILRDGKMYSVQGQEVR